VVFLATRSLCGAAPFDGDPIAPFRIIGPVHYVGTTELGAYLVTTREGHVLVDGGYESTAPIVLASIRALGFDPKDVRVLLTTQAHFDHVGSLAAFVKASGAKVMVMRGDADLVERGGHRDPVFGDQMTFPPVHVDRVLEDGDSVTVGDVTLTAHRTAGHTPGCTTWTMDATEGGRVYHVTIAGSLTVLPQMRLVNDPTYPGIAEDFARSIQVLRNLPTDVFLAAHGQMFDLVGKEARLRAGASPNPFMDSQGYREYLDGAERAYRDRLASER
jgi:metallo-beta-lactamase class B